MFTYYPRMSHLSMCSITNSMAAWAKVTNNSMWVKLSLIISNNIFLSYRPLDYYSIQKWLLERQWTPQSIADWQTFYNSSSKTLIYGSAGNFISVDLPKLPDYEDFKPDECKRNTTSSGQAWVLRNFFYVWQQWKWFCDLKFSSYQSIFEWNPIFYWRSELIVNKLSMIITREMI